MTTKEDTRSLNLEFDLPHPPAKVWRALTEPDLVGKWLMGTDMKLSIGQNFTFKMAAQQGWDGVIHCQMKEVEPQKRLRYSWASMGMETLVTLTLTPGSNGGTLLRVEQSGFPGDKSQARYFEGAKMGWQGMAGQRLPNVLSEMP